MHFWWNRWTVDRGELEAWKQFAEGKNDDAVCHR